MFVVSMDSLNVISGKIDGIRFDVIEDEAVFNEKGITLFPVLEVDDKMLSFTEAVQWLKEIKNGH